MSSLVDWRTARRVATLAAGDERELPPPGPLRAAVTESQRAVERYTGLEPREPIPEPEWVSRERWALINLAGLEAAIAPVEERLREGPEPPGPLQGAVSGTLGFVTGAQIGALVGYASRRVLGQYEFPILGSERPPRLLFVAANVSDAEQELGDRGPTVLRWIALHEVTHAVHFGAAPWLRGHLRTLVGELLTDSRIRVEPAEIAPLARRLVSTDPRRLLSELWRSDPLALLAPPQSRRTLERTQATMAAVEGFAEHVMDAAAPLLGEEIAELRLAMDRRREERPPLARLLAWLLGLELKLRQYRDGKRFCDGVVELGGVETLNQAWTAADALPDSGELADPGAWLRRTASIHA